MSARETVDCRGTQKPVAVCWDPERGRKNGSGGSVLFGGPSLSLPVTLLADGTAPIVILTVNN